MLNTKKKDKQKEKKKYIKSLPHIFIRQQNNQKIRDKAFNIFISRTIIQNQNEQRKLNSTLLNQTSSQANPFVLINSLREFSQNLINNFYSIYQIDSKSYQWVNKIQNLLISIRQIMRIIQKLKKQIKQVQTLKSINSSLHFQNLRINKILSQIDIVQKNKFDFVKQKYDNEIRNLNDNLQLKQILITEKQSVINSLKHQLKTYKEEVSILKQQKIQLNQQITLLKQYVALKDKEIFKINQSCFKLDYTNSHQDDVQIQCKIQNKDILKLTKQDKQLKQRQISNLFQQKLIVNSKICPKLIQFMTPQSIISLFCLNKKIRLYIYKSKSCMLSIFSSITRTKNYEIKQFQRHISHFQSISKKIPQQVIQSTFYQYNILKEQIGGPFFQIIKMCGQIFQGKIGNKNQEHKIVKQYIQSKQILNHFVQMPKDQQILLKIDQQTVSYFIEERKLKKQHTLKQIQSLYHKIMCTEDLYKIDQVTLKQFYLNLTKLFTILFVLSKNLYSQSRNLQQLNNFLLGQLNQISKFQVQKKYDFEDIKAQLQSQTKMKQFLSQKYHQSQQKVLKQNKQNIQLEKISRHLKQIIKQKQNQIKNIFNQKRSKEEQNDLLKNKYKDVKKVYQTNRQKYNQLIKQLIFLKQRVIKQSHSS